MEFKSDKWKKLTNKKILLGLTSIIVSIALIIVTSFVPFAIDPTRWQTIEFLSDELVICTIVITSMVSAMFIGQSSNGQNEKSRLAKARVKFFDTVVKITNISSFNQWIKQVQQPRDIKSMQERKMRAIGIEDYTVIDLEYAEIKSLIDTPQKINNRYYKSLTKEQVKELIKIKRGKYKVVLVEPEYYLSAKTLIDNRTITERASKEGTKKSLYLTRSVISKLLLSLISAMIFASLMKDINDIDKAEAIAKFLSRIWSMFSSIFLGYIVGTQINDIDAEYIDMRVTVQNMFLQDVDFVPLTQQEIAMQEYKKSIAKQKE